MPLLLAGNQSSFFAGSGTGTEAVLDRLARRLRRMSEAQALTDDAVLQLLSEVKGNQVEYVKVPVDKLRSFFHPDTSVKQMTETLVKAMDFYNKHLARQRKDRDAR